MIDFSFIAKLEGNECKGYVPDPENSQSGVTIASGFDIGQRSFDEISNAFEVSLAEKLLPYIGKKKQEALDFLEQNPLEVTEQEAELINEYSHSNATERLKQLWQNSDAQTGFDDLPDECQTVVASVAFQYGNLATRTPNFWKQVTAEDWDGAEANLRNFGDKYATRRHQEADLLASRG